MALIERIPALRLTSLRNWALFKVLVGCIRLTGCTSKSIQLHENHPDGLQQNYILSTWHSNGYFGSWLLKGRNYGCLISHSRDGDLMSQLAKHFAFVAIRGSSSKGGIRGLIRIVKYLKNSHPVVISPDGPRGPKHKVQLGVLMMAKMTGMPIIPWDYETLDQWIIKKSWDGHKVPKPFTVAVSRFGAPFHVPADLSNKEMATYCEKLEQAMNANHQQIVAKLNQLKQVRDSHFLGKLYLLWAFKEK